jgi:hypothetical protein
LLPLPRGTDGNDCSAQFFDNGIACDGPNAIPSRLGLGAPLRRGEELPAAVSIALNRSEASVVIF